MFGAIVVNLVTFVQSIFLPRVVREMAPKYDRRQCHHGYQSHLFQSRELNLTVLMYAFARHSGESATLQVHRLSMTKLTPHSKFRTSNFPTGDNTLNLQWTFEPLSVRCAASAHGRYKCQTTAE